MQLDNIKKRMEIYSKRKVKDQEDLEDHLDTECTAVGNDVKQKFLGIISSSNQLLDGINTKFIETKFKEDW
ncbi:hypothetical protein F8M41_001903 [Gigaspora margarita]|uniref:Uncharacterized protein n=1 Tax=Gigaspora margarita TaxID=4874 RepID=A0A8H3XDP0_GIGMA|nr:hypothetical protein F8M41_001903 [Gigaspora margarita]